MFDVKNCCYSVEVTHITRQFYIILNIIQYACRMQKYEREIFFLPFIAFLDETSYIPDPNSYQYFT